LKIKEVSGTVDMSSLLTLVSDVIEVDEWKSISNDWVCFERSQWISLTVLDPAEDSNVSRHRGSQSLSLAKHHRKHLEQNGAPVIPTSPPSWVLRAISGSPSPAYRASTGFESLRYEISKGCIHR
jgi:hypothetical protein